LRSGISNEAYRYEMTDRDHRELAEKLKQCKGRVIISGYGSDLYNELYAGWDNDSKMTHADGARERIESIWMNFRINKLF